MRLLLKYTGTEFENVLYEQGEGESNYSRFCPTADVAICLIILHLVVIQLSCSKSIGESAYIV